MNGKHIISCDTFRDYCENATLDNNHAQMMINAADSLELKSTQDGALSIPFLAYCDRTGRNSGKRDHIVAVDRDVEIQLSRRALPEKSSLYFHETLVAQWDEKTMRVFILTGHESYPALSTSETLRFLLLMLYILP